MSSPFLRLFTLLPPLPLRHKLDVGFSNRFFGLSFLDVVRYYIFARCRSRNSIGLAGVIGLHSLRAAVICFEVIKCCVLGS